MILVEHIKIGSEAFVRKRRMAIKGLANYGVYL